MYDVTNYSSLAHIDDWFNVIQKGGNPEFPILVVGGKADLPDREVFAEEAIKIAKSRNVEGFIECSAKSGVNVDKSFIALTRLMIANSDLI